MSLLGEPKRCKVLRVAAGYVVFARVLIQVGGLTAPSSTSVNDYQ